MFSLAVLLILAACPAQISSFMPGMDKSENFIQISDIYPQFVSVGPITYTTKMREIKYMNHVSATINVTRPIGPLGGSVQLKDPGTGRRMTLYNSTNICQSIMMAKMIFPMPEVSLNEKCILKEETYTFTDVPLEFTAPGMIPEGEYDMVFIAHEKYEALLEVEMKITISDEKKKEKILKIDSLDG